MESDKNLELEETQQVSPSMDSKLAAVRDLIFGENIQQYQKEFDEVHQLIADSQAASDESRAELAARLDKRIDDLQASVEASMEKMIQQFENKMADLDDKKADRRKLGKALEKIALMLQV